MLLSKLLPGLVLSLPVGTFSLGVRLWLLRKEDSKKPIIVQIILLLFYLVVYNVLTYIDIMNYNIYWTQELIYLFAGFYFVEPLLMYILFFRTKKIQSISFGTYFINTVIFTFIIIVLTFVILVLYLVVTGQFYQ